MSPRLVGNLAGIIGMLVWTTGLPVTAEVLKTWHPLLLVPARMICGGLFLFLLVSIWDKQPKYSLRVLWDITLAGTFLALSSIILVWGQGIASPVTVSIIIAGMPAVSAAVGLATGLERLNSQTAAGIVLAFAGGAVATLGGDHQDARATFGLGEGLVFLSTVFFVLFTRISVDRLNEMTDLTRCATTVTASAVVSLVIGALIAATGLLDLGYSFTPITLGLIFWLGAGTMGISMAFWLTACRMLGVTVASMHNNLVPFYAILFALILGQAVTIEQIIGGALVIAGAILAQLQFKTLRFRIR